MINKRLPYYLLLLLLLAGCKSSKVSERKLYSEGEAQYVQAARQLLQPPAAGEVTSKLQLTFKGYNLSGQLRMRWNGAVQLSLNMLGLMEVARVEFLPDMVVVMDRVNHLYATETYAHLPYRNLTGLDFNSIQSIFWNRMFAPGYPQTDALDHLAFSNQGSGPFFSDADYGYKFYLNPDGQVTSIKKEGSSYTLSFSYSKYESVSGLLFLPTEMNLAFDGSEDQVTAMVRLSSMKVSKGDWENATSLSNRYKRVSLEQLLSKFDL